MHEVEFLPEWYPRVRSRRRLLLLQGWLALLVAGGLALWLTLAHRNVADAGEALASIEQQLSQANMDLERLEELRVLQRQWRQQDQIVTRLGLHHVEATRLLQALATLMPEEMALLEVALEVTQEQPRALNSLVRTNHAAQESSQPQRLMKIRLGGVAPTDMTLATFLARLGEVPFFERLAVAFVRDRNDSGHVMREFELTFVIRLSRQEVGTG